jgi:hypothetical protein
MTTTELKAKIQAAATLALTGYATEYGTDAPGTYIYAIRDIQNMSYNNPLPHIYCEELTVRKNLGTGVIEWPGIYFAFLDQDTADSSADQMEGIKDRMESLFDLFHAALIADDDDMMDNVTFDLSPISKINQGMFSGYGGTVTIRATIEC